MACANSFDGRNVVVRDEVPPVALCNSWPDMARISRYNYASTGILILSPDHEAEITDALNAVRDFRTVNAAAQAVPCL